jgi:hypothetical protein
LRITSLLAVVAAGLTFALTGCGGTYVPEEAPASESAQVTAKQPALAGSSDQTVTEMSICPLQWWCDTTMRYYSTSTQCAAACGSTACYRDYNCNGFCTCP